MLTYYIYILFLQSALVADYFYIFIYIFFRVGYVLDNKKFSWQISGTARSQKTRDFLFLNIDINNTTSRRHAI